MELTIQRVFDGKRKFIGYEFKIDEICYHILEREKSIMRMGHIIARFGETLIYEIITKEGGK